MKKTNKIDTTDLAWSSKGTLNKRNDVRITRIRQLQHRQARDQQRLFLCEGARFVVKALEAGVHIQECVYSPQLFPTPFCDKLVRQLTRRGVPMLRVSPEVFLSVTLADEPSGLLAVCRQKVLKVGRTQPSGPPLYLVLDAVRSAGNLGTIMRTSVAAGVDGVILLTEDTDPFHPAAVRGSMGAIMGLNIIRAGRDEFLKWAKRSGVQLIGTSPSAEVDFHQVDYSLPTAVIMGSERKGMNAELFGACDRLVTIPMSGATDSLNLAVATGIVLFEAFARRHSKGIWSPLI